MSRCSCCHSEKLVEDSQKKTFTCFDCFLEFDYAEANNVIPICKDKTRDFFQEQLVEDAVETVARGEEICLHHEHLVITRDGDATCNQCGRVVLYGVGLFHLAYLEGAAYCYRKGTYKIKYYFNEKIAQWGRTCPKPSADTFAALVGELRDQNRYGLPSGFGRRTIAQACKRIGKPTLQEKHLLLLEMLRDTDKDYFGSIVVPEKPHYRLLNDMRRVFNLTLPAWMMCRDIDVTTEFRRRHPKRSLPSHYGSKRRKSYPHNYSKFSNGITCWVYP